MTWRQIESQWYAVKDRIGVHFSRLSAADIAQLDGRRERILDALERRYGIARDTLERELDSFVASMDDSGAAAGR